MAVTEPKQVLIRDFWPRFRTNAIVLTILMQLISATVAFLALRAAHIAPESISFWIAMSAMLAASIGVNLILLFQVLLPLKDLTRALTHVAGEPTTTTPPNPNASRYERNGFKPLLQLIYKQASQNQPATTQTSAISTELKTAESALDNAPIGVVVMDTDRKITYHNSAAPIRVATDESSILDIEFPSDAEDLSTWLKECDEHSVHAQHTWRRLYSKKPDSDERKIFDMLASYQKGSTAEVVLSLIDRTEEYQPEDDDLDFLAFAAHELRGPITVIRGYLDVLSDELSPSLQEDQLELLKRLTVSANRLSSYVNNILNSSRYDRRHLSVHLQENSLSDIYTTIKDDMELRASSQNRMLTVSIPEDLPTIAADPGSLTEVLGNLIDNAIKYSNEGGLVQVSAAHEGDWVKVNVEDHGIGIPGSVMSNLFHKFYRSHRSRETVAGTGIGLYITKGIVESHGGTIEVRSTEGEGSTFSFTVPVYAAVAQKLKADDNSNKNFIEHEGGWIKNHAMYRG